MNGVVAGSYRKGEFLAELGSHGNAKQLLPRLRSRDVVVSLYKYAPIEHLGLVAYSLLEARLKDTGSWAHLVGVLVRHGLVVYDDLAIRTVAKFRVASDDGGAF